MKPSRWILMALLWAALLYAIADLSPYRFALFEPLLLLYVVLVPWLVTAACAEPGETLAALRDGLHTRADRSTEARRTSADILRSVGGLALATGLVIAFTSMLLLFKNLSVEPDPSGTTAWVMARLGSLSLAPFYGLALRQFLYEPVANAVAGPPSLGEVLADE